MDFDPLVRRNARLNLVRLGADVTDYLPDFYGAMDDAVNAGDRSDRLLARCGSGRRGPGGRRRTALATLDR